MAPQGANTGTKGFWCGLSTRGWQCPVPVLLPSKGKEGDHASLVCRVRHPGSLLTWCPTGKEGLVLESDTVSWLAQAWQSMLRCSCRSCSILSPEPIFHLCFPAPGMAWHCSLPSCSAVAEAACPHTLTPLTVPHTLCPASFLQPLLGIGSLFFLPVFPWQPDPILVPHITFTMKFS